MSDVEATRRKGMQMLADVAAHYAQQHGLTGAISWEAVTGEQFSLVMRTATQTVTIPFSLEEIEDFPGGDGTGYSKKKIRDKFAGLSM